MLIYLTQQNILLFVRYLVKHYYYYYHHHHHHHCSRNNQHDRFHHHRSYLQVGLYLLFYLKSTETYYS